MLKLLENSESEELQDLLYEKVGELFSCCQSDDEVTTAYRKISSQSRPVLFLNISSQDVLPQLQPAPAERVSEGGQGRHLRWDHWSLLLDSRAESGALAGLQAGPPLWEDCPRAGGGDRHHGHLRSQEVERRDGELHPD